MSEILLSLENVRVQFGRFLAVDDVSFELRGGELLGLIGPNGAGKTTTLRAAVGLQPITTGRIRVFGFDVFDHPSDVNQHLALTPDTPQVYEPMRVSDFLRFIGRAYKLDRKTTEERIDHWLGALWLKDKREATISSLSRGMRQRLAVARSLLPNPNLVLMDEPAAGLDPAGRVEFRRLLASLRDQGKALIVSSHILADLAEFCTHIGIIGHGKLLQYGTVAEIAGGDAAVTRYRVGLAERRSDVALRLEGIPDLRDVQIAGDVVVFTYSSDRAAAAKLLRTLIESGLPVASFQPTVPDLEQAYLRTGLTQVD